MLLTSLSPKTLAFFGFFALSLSLSFLFSSAKPQNSRFPRQFSAWKCQVFELTQKISFFFSISLLQSWGGFGNKKEKPEFQATSLAFLLHLGDTNLAEACKVANMVND
ncbi:hypothetical protein V6N11_021419 [Hibiscus sabdariffa]|uniref:Uncharacterized protein n=1 Tax=Hibiscus sabdariffa TaxID=183260 RepID=A0ABR1ZTD1_9ROSI